MRDRRTQERARRLRKHSTEAERLLWYHLRRRRLGFRFRRQFPVGPFIADFACLERRLVIELDGGQHQGRAGDRARDRYMTSAGWHVLRFWNNDVLQRTEAVLEVIRQWLISPPP